jgi:hemerythrin superfamily protein
MDVLSLLKKDHRTVGALLDQATACEPDDERLDALATEIEVALTIHAALEEKYFYPVLRERAEESEDTVDVFEAYTEHALVKKLIELLKSPRQPGEQFKAEVQVLAENVKHHVKEEESKIFTLARELLDADELEELGETMAAAKQRLTASSARPAKRAPAKRTPARKSAPARKTGPARKNRTKR